MDKLVQMSAPSSPTHELDVVRVITEENNSDDNIK